MGEPIDETKQRTARGGFRMACQLTQQRTCEITGYWFTDDSMDDLNRRLDEAREALDRQVIAADVVHKEAMNANILAGIEKMADDAAMLTKKKAGAKENGVGLNSQEKLFLQNSQAQIASQRKQFQSNEAAIKAAKAKLALNGAAPHAA